MPASITSMIKQLVPQARASSVQRKAQEAVAHVYEDAVDVEIQRVMDGGAPANQIMDRGLMHLEKHEQLLVAQTRKGCVQELLGCEAKNEFKIFPNKESQKDPSRQVMYSLEESGCLMRFCCGSNRSFTQTVWAGNGALIANPETVMKIKRPLACPNSPCCCCNFAPCMQTISVGTAGGDEIGGAELPCYICIPSIKVKNAQGEVTHQVQQPACCGGMCVDVCAEGLCNCKIPFYIYPPDRRPRDGKQIGKIVKLWKGLGTEMFTDADNFQVEYPPGSDAADKARLLGTVFFINILFFEKSN